MNEADYLCASLSGCLYLKNQWLKMLGLLDNTLFDLRTTISIKINLIMY